MGPGLGEARCGDFERLLKRLPNEAKIKAGGSLRTTTRTEFGA